MFHVVKKKKKKVERSWFCSSVYAFIYNKLLKYYRINAQELELSMLLNKNVYSQMLFCKKVLIEPFASQEATRSWGRPQS